MFFDLDVSTPWRIVIAFVIILPLIWLTFWALRRFGGERLGSTTARGRQPRLAVIDAAMVDGRRRLVLIRRDNVEHLLMIGGPSDLVVEPNIVRAASTQREAPPARPPAASDTLPRPVPLGEGSMWPLQPEPAPREPAPREPAPRQPRAPAPMALPEESIQWSTEPEPPPAPPVRERRPPRPAPDPLAGLAEELARAPAQPDAPEPPRQPRREPRAQRPQPPPAAAPPPPPAPAPAVEPPFNSTADQNLADMAQRLEAALRRPPAEPAPQPAAEARPVRTEPRPARAEAKPAAAPKSLYDSLEQEMASLLGRPDKKP